MDNPFSLIRDILSGPMQWWLVFLLICCVLFVAESIWPAEKGHTLKGRIRNIAFSLFFVILGSICVYLVLQWYGSLVRVYQEPRSVTGSLLSLFSTLLIGDFFYYWYHRAQHRFSTLWLIHELHHADEELNVTTSRRTYFLEKPIQLFVIVVPALYLPQSLPLLSFAVMDQAAINLYPYIAIFWLIFAHANIRLPLGWLTVVATGPQYHRIHHSNLPQHRDKNFAQFFPLLDKLFGTYYRPGVSEYPPTGAPHLQSDEKLWVTQVRPFQQWGRMLVELGARLMEVVRLTR